MATYPVVLERDDNDTWLVSFPDFPEAHTFGATKEEALVHAVDALETVIDAYIKDKRGLPNPSAVKGESVTLPAIADAKMQIYAAMRARDIKKADLSRRLRVHMPQVDRLLDIRHGSKVEQLEACARALGGELRISLVIPQAISTAAQAVASRHLAVTSIARRKSLGAALKKR